MTQLIQALSLVALHILSTFLLIGLLSFISKTQNRYLLLWFLLFFLLSTFILFIPKFPPFVGLERNWQGKILSCFLPFIFLYFFRKLSKKEAGFTLEINKKVWLPFIILTILGLIFNVLVRGIPGEKASLSYLAFELTMPGLSEEPIFRGVLLGLLNLVFISRKDILGVNIGWGFLIQSFLFGIGHSCYFDELSHFQFSAEIFLVTFILGLILSYLKEKSGSIVVPILYHNIYNATLPILSLFV